MWRGVLGVLNQDDHRERHDRRAGVDDELPGGRADDVQASQGSQQHDQGASRTG